MAGVVTISASYGAGGAFVGPAVAERLGLEFYDRAIPLEVARRLAVSADEAAAADEKPPRLVDRLLAALANVAAPMGADPGQEVSGTRTSYCAGTEAVLRQIADTAGGVVLGRAAMVVLGDRPDVLCVRLDGPAEQRAARAAARAALDLDAARAELRQADRAREAYAQVFYGVSQSDARLYHLVIDTMALSVETCVEMVVLAARERFSALST
jgi:cytidylate kinase